LADSIADWGRANAWVAYGFEANPYGPDMPAANGSLATRWLTGWLVGNAEVKRCEEQEKQ